MKIKKIKNIDKIQVKLSHLELMVIKKALQNSEKTIFDINEFNNEVFDKDEVKKGSDIKKINKKIQKQINKKTKKVYPY